MDAGTAATYNGRLRHQLLNNDGAMPDRRVGTHQQFYQMQAAAPDPSPRKASMTSQTARNFFRRKRPDAFDDDTGADIQDLTGNNVSFDDISHIRDRGPYGAGATSLDSTPIIPTLSSISSNGKITNNIHYRKQMNHNMKMQLANGARAMSLAGANPMQANYNPRAMSLASGPRTMSLNPHAAAGVPHDPRAMSLNRTGAPAPRLMSMKPNQMGPYPQPPRAMSLSAQSAMAPPGQRTMSMNGQANLHAPPMPHNSSQMNMQALQQQQIIQQQMLQQQQMMQQQQQYLQQQMQQPISYQQPMQHPMKYPMQQPMQHAGYASHPQQPYGHYTHPAAAATEYAKAPRPPALASTTSSVYEGSVPTSSDSLMNVPEEDEDVTRKITNLAQEPEVDENAAIYRFDGDDNDNISVSRKSTIRKSNSMRLRKLNLFDNDVPKNIDEEDASSNLPSPDVGDFSSGSKSPDKPNKSPLRNEFDSEVSGSILDPKSLSKQISQKSLTKNTAFHNFRSTSSLNKMRSRETEDEASTSQTGLNSYYEEKQIALDEKTKALKSENILKDPNVQSKDTSGQYNTFSDKSDATASGEVLHSTPPTTNTSNYSSSSTIQNDHIGRQDETDIFDSATKAPVTPTAIAQRSFSEMTLQDSPKADKRNSRSFSIGGKSKNIFKRLSKSSRRSSAAFEEEADLSSRKNSVISNMSQRHSTSYAKNTPIFTKEELGIMSANNELLNELELVTTELASSIRRELDLENRLKGLNLNSGKNNDLEAETRLKAKTISSLEEKLTKERRLRYISEEHALLLENGQSPSALKLNYEKTELYRQLLVKNDLVNQLQDKLDEYQKKDSKEDTEDDDGPNLLEKYNELLKENANLKFQVIPELEERIEEQNKGAPAPSATRQRQLSLMAQRESYDADDDFNQSHDQIEILTLKTQRDELREIIMKINSSHNYEMKLASEKLKSYAVKLKEQTELNEKLRQRLGANTTFSPTSGALNTGAKLQGFTIVSPNKSLFDD